MPVFTISLAEEVLVDAEPRKRLLNIFHKYYNLVKTCVKFR